MEMVETRRPLISHSCWKILKKAVHSTKLNPKKKQSNEFMD